jgi:Tol biopolymer transport system component
MIRHRFLGAMWMVAVVALGAMPAAAQSPAPSEPASAGTWTLLDQRPVEIEDTRVISMSPDGRLIVAAAPAFAYQRGQLCVYLVETLEQQACADLSGIQAGIRLEDVTWSPDGSKIAFGEEAFILFRDGDLWLMDTATGEVTNLDDDGFEGNLPLLRPDDASGMISIPVSPAFSPDGTMVAFSRSLVVDGERGGNEISVVPVAGGEPRRVVLIDEEAFGSAYFGIRWAPNGSQIYYSVHHPEVDDPRNGIWVVEATGRGPRLVIGSTDPEAGAPGVLQVSAGNDRLLAFYPLLAARYGVSREVYALVDPITGASEAIEPPGKPERPAEFVTLTGFSPDGSGLLEVIRNSDPDNQVFVRDLATNAVTPLVPDGLPAAGPITYGLTPTWAANGTAFITGGAALSRGTLLTIEGGLPAS